MITVLLYGFLGEKFGKVHRYDVKTPTEAIRALSCTIKGFKQAIIDGGYYKILRAGKDALNLEDLNLPQSSKETLRIVPVIQGSGKGLTSIILGVALMAFAVPLGAALFSPALAAAGTSAIFSFGVSLVLGGVSQLLFSPPEAPATIEPVNNRPSYVFNGAVNTTAQGNPVPICYGKLRVGSQIISASLSVEQI